MEINWPGEGLDTIASLSGKYGRWLNVNHKRACFLVWSGCALYWAVRDFNLGLYSQCISCVFSVGLNLYGFHKWRGAEKSPTTLTKEYNQSIAQ
jgi:hypothetical protein